MDKYENYDLRDEQWKRIEPLLPPEYAGKKERPRKGNRMMLNGMLWMNHSVINPKVFEPVTEKNWGLCLPH